MKVADFVANKIRAATTRRRRMSEKKNDETKEEEVGRIVLLVVSEILEHSRVHTVLEPRKR